jgi:hypothetical protein
MKLVRVIDGNTGLVHHGTRGLGGPGWLDHPGRLARQRDDDLRVFSWRRAKESCLRQQGTGGGKANAAPRQAGLSLRGEATGVTATAPAAGWHHLHARLIIQGQTMYMIIKNVKHFLMMLIGGTIPAESLPGAAVIVGEGEIGDIIWRWKVVRFLISPES